MDYAMPTATNKQRLLNQLFGALSKRYGAADDDARPVLEQFIYGICREGTTRERADRVFKALQERFFDWNEIRVSSPRELEEVLSDLPDAELRAQRLIRFLQEVFEKRFAFDLEDLHKKGLKVAAKHLSGYEAANEYVGAWVVQQSLGGHAIPLDAPTLRCARRLGLVDQDVADPEALRSSLEHLVPKARGPLFVDLVSRLAEDCCWEEDPSCVSCPLSAECPTAHELGRNGAPTTGRSSRPKPR
jgi:endonuclease III